MGSAYRGTNRVLRIWGRWKNGTFGRRAEPAKADIRPRSKWSRVMRYAVAYKPDSEALDEYIKRKGGINECAGRFSQRLGRGAPRRTES
jgi:hypothetical protein